MSKAKRIALPVANNPEPRERVERCDGCKFWQREEKGNLTDYEATPPWASEELPEGHPNFIGVGQCLRFPPVFVAAIGQETIATIVRNHGLRLELDNMLPSLSSSVWPRTREFDWCGEWAASGGA